VNSQSLWSSVASASALPTRSLGSPPTDLGRPPSGHVAGPLLAGPLVRFLTGPRQCRILTFARVFRKMGRIHGLEIAE
jgi:hypothetical protein